MHIIGFGTEADPESLGIFTKKRYRIRDSQPPEMEPAYLLSMARFHETRYDSIRRRSLTATYNCYGMVFASRRTSLVEPKEIYRILQDDGYERIHDRLQVRLGDVVLYRMTPQGDISHVGLVSRIDFSPRNFELLSKWGDCGEYFHNENIVPPEFGRPSEYWSERKLGEA
jgi:hypothetical protein